MRRTTVIGFLGSTLDASKRDAARWNKWRPTVGLCMQPDLRIDRLILLHGHQHEGLAHFIADDIASVSPETSVEPRVMNFDDAWDFEEVYTELLDFAQGFAFDPEAEDYLVHITTGTHVAQICMFLLTEARFIPGKLLQTQPKRGAPDPSGVWNAIDLDLSRYDTIAQRFAEGSKASTSFLKGGIETRNEAFNTMIDEIEQVATRSSAPLLVMGPTGAGKGALARRIYELKVERHRLSGPFVEVNCATLKGDNAMAALFGHTKGAFTGAVTERAGLLRSADKGMLFLDEIGETEPGMQVRLLRVLQEGEIRPIGSSDTLTVDVRVLAATNRDLESLVQEGRFREDLFYRLRVVEITVPPLRERRSDIPALAHHFLEGANKRMQRKLSGFSNAAMDLLTANSWRGNVRELENEIERVVALAGEEEQVSVKMLSGHIRSGRSESEAVDSSDDEILDWNLNHAVDNMKRHMIVVAIREAGSKTRAAERLGIPRQSLQKTMKRLGLTEDTVER